MLGVESGRCEGTIEEYNSKAKDNIIAFRVAEKIKKTEPVTKVPECVIEELKAEMMYYRRQANRVPHDALARVTADVIERCLIKMGVYKENAPEAATSQGK